jgi:hypothetical protein
MAIYKIIIIIIIIGILVARFRQIFMEICQICLLGSGMGSQRCEGFFKVFTFLRGL